MSKLERELAARFDGSKEDAAELHRLCKIALEALKSAEQKYSELEISDGHLRSRKGLTSAAADISYFGMRPLESKFPELKS